MSVVVAIVAIVFVVILLSLTGAERRHGEMFPAVVHRGPAPSTEPDDKHKDDGSVGAPSFADAIENDAAAHHHHGGGFSP